MRMLMIKLPCTTTTNRYKLLQNQSIHILHNGYSSSKYSKLLETCSTVKQVKQLHAQIIVWGFCQNTYLGYHLISAYEKFHSLDSARIFLKSIPCIETNVIMWNSMLRGYSKHGLYEKCLELYCQMQNAGVGFHGDDFTFTSVLKACAALLALQWGLQLHVVIIKIGLESRLFTANALLAMYAKCRCLEDARQVFDRMSLRDVVSWNSMIGGYVHNGRWSRGLEVYHRMKAEAGIQPDYLTFVSLLTSLVDLQQGREIHGCIITGGIESDIEVGNALIGMYAKCGSFKSAIRVFGKMVKRDVISWTAMMAGYVQNGLAREALVHFHKMQVAGVKANSVTIISVLPVCTHLVALKKGKELHNSVIRSGFESDVFVGSALIDMYAKCGSIKNAMCVFDKVPRKDSALWTAMIAAYSMHGRADEALELFSRMQELGFKPDYITLVAILSACSRAGMVDKGRIYFYRMSEDFNIAPGLEHYACVVDLLGRAGHLDEAYDIINHMPLKPNDDVWGALLGACRIHQNIHLGELVAERLYDLKPKKAGYYVLMSNIYAAAGRWDGVAKVREIMKEKGVIKDPGYAWIEIHNKVHAFLVEDRAHPQSAEIYKTLEVLAKQMKEAGYVPNKSFVLQDVEDEEKEHILGGHSEKLAIAFGIMNTNPGTSLRIIKNLRICGDCHHATKFISRIIQREIIIRDLSRFHHFKDGECSCGDYW